MGGKNACVVTARGDLERAATGIVRSAFGLTGQKCSALSRVYVEEAVADALLAQAGREARGRSGSATPACARTGWGRSSTRAPREAYERYCARLARDGGRILVGGRAA